MLSGVSFLTDKLRFPEKYFIFAWLRESTCVRDAWKRRKMCVISWNHSKTCVISWKACFSSNFSVFAWKSQFFIDCVNAWKWKKICVIAWLGTPPGGGLLQVTKIFRNMEPWPTILYVSIVGYDGAYLGPECFFTRKSVYSPIFFIIMFFIKKKA